MPNTSFSSELPDNSYNVPRRPKVQFGFLMLLSGGLAFGKIILCFLIAVECDHTEENMPSIINHSVYYRLFEKAENAHSYIFMS